jgi:hypothetical protein
LASILRKPYTSPARRAQEIVADHARSPSDASSTQLRHAQQIVDFARQVPFVSGDLERAEAPWHVFRWVAWDPRVDGCRQRAKLALHLRRHLAGQRGGWLQERDLTAAFGVWEQARAAARKRGGIMPAVDQIPLDDYRHAIETAPRKAANAPAGEPANVLDPGAVSAKREDPPASLLVQMQIVRHFALALRTALDAGDLGAARVANDAILRLAGEAEDDAGRTDVATPEPQQTPSEQVTQEQAPPAQPAEQTTAQQPAPSPDRAAPRERQTTGVHEVVDAGTARAVNDTRPLIDILLGR